MQYWKKNNSGSVESISDDTISKHPEKIDLLKHLGYVRVKSKSDSSVFQDQEKKLKKKPIKKKPIVKKKKTKSMKK